MVAATSRRSGRQNRRQNDRGGRVKTHVTYCIGEKYKIYRL